VEDGTEASATDVEVESGRDDVAGSVVERLVSVLAVGVMPSDKLKGERFMV